MSSDQKSAEGTALQQMRQDDQFFCSLINTIPAKFYFDQDTVKEIREKILETTESALGGSQRFGKLGQAGKHRFAKLNPAINKSVLRILEEVDAEEKGKRQKQNKKIKKDRLTLLSKQGTLHSPALDRASSIEALQQSLRQKIEKMKSGRDLEQIRARREIEKLRQQKNKRGTGNQMKGGKAKTEGSMEVDPVTPPANSKSKAVFNSEGKMVFSKFDFSNNGAPDAPIANNKALKKMTNVKGLKGYKKQLEFVEEKQKKLEELKESDPNKAAEIEEKAAWLDAIDKSKGIKKKNDPEMLRKSIKKREKLKERSRKKWADRQDTVRKQQDERQAKRKANLQARREQKVSHKLKKLSKKGRVLNVPGF
ncbi:surfeit locus protein 6 homolog [Galendromus occidentalis]|uniref:Surfeit locus protein 6 homolog n=1 Tax=Galendromus occidentalis TaxID=34638 RepID=A0AAJ6VY70_9ACAR|nr:surfeit locus protein 6 homolog [Galendromus occidentalis]